MKGYKVTDSKMKCRGYQFEIGKTETITGELSICNNGFHFCQQLPSCFNYYDFDKSNRVFEIETGEFVITEGDKSCAESITIIREISWPEVLQLANAGIDNTGHSNSGDRNSGYSNSGDSNSGDSNSGNWNSGDRNSGNWNSGYRNSGDRNSGDRNSGYRNSGNWNSGDRNSGNWNSGDRNSGDSNSGYRNSGAFCIDNDPLMVLFDKPCKTMTVREWENSKACQLMSNIDPTIWVPASIMSDSEKEDHPSWKTTDGYLKTITMKEAWMNFWGNLSDSDKSVFTSLENFDASKFEEITGIKIG